jgi:hypothetical protein
LPFLSALQSPRHQFAKEQSPTDGPIGITHTPNLRYNINSLIYAFGSRYIMYNQEYMHYGGQLFALEHVSPIDIAPRGLIILPLYGVNTPPVA